MNALVHQYETLPSQQKLENPRQLRRLVRKHDIKRLGNIAEMLGRTQFYFNGVDHTDTNVSVRATRSCLRTAIAEVSLLIQDVAAAYENTKQLRRGEDHKKLVVHWLSHGWALCGMGIPAEWQDNHRWASLKIGGVKKVTCPRCLKYLAEARTKKSGGKKIHAKNQVRRRKR